MVQLTIAFKIHMYEVISLERKKKQENKWNSKIPQSLIQDAREIL